MSDNDENDNDGLDEQLRKLFQEPEQIQKKNKELPLKPNSQQRGRFSEFSERHGSFKPVSPIDQKICNVRQNWRSISNDRRSRNIDTDQVTDTQPKSKYLQSFNKQSNNIKQNWKSSTTDRRYNSGYTQDSVDSTRSSTSSQWRSPRRQLGTKATFKNDRVDDKDLDLLVQLSYLEAEQICQTLSEEKFVFLDVLDNDVSLNQLVLLLRIMNKLWSSTFDEYKIKMITQSCDMKILDKLKKHLIRLPIQDATDKIVNEHFWKEPETFWTNLHNFYENLFHFMPNTACELLPKMIKISLIAINGVMQYNEINISTNTIEIFEDCQRRLSEFIEKEEAKKSVEEEEPPDNFKDINPYPSVKEIKTRDAPFIRPIITEGAYQSVQHYLDVQYRLLREDFVASLRNGICTYLEKEDEDTFEKQYDVRIYERVKFLQPYFVHNRIAQLVQYSSKKNRKLNPEDSEHFIYGSLVCFTIDYFKTVIFGTVVDNDIKFLRKGQIIVNINDTVLYNYNYLMVVCNVFFEPYYHVLQSIKKIDENKFPFKKYIIDVSSDTDHPKYITNLTSVYYKDRNFRILSPETWPSAEQMKLNVSQYKAFQSALTREFCIIQGPPGTGKTYTSLKIVQFILNNRYNLKYSGPILVVCFTNHALDQFLEGLLPFTDRLLRVGGRSKSIELEKYNLKHYKKIAREFSKKIQQEDQYFTKDELCYSDEDGRYDKYHYLDLKLYSDKLKAVNNCYKEVCYNLEPIQQYMAFIDAISLNDGIINFKYFGKIDRNIIGTWFINAQTSDIIEWLMEGENDNIYNTNHLQQVNEKESNLYLKAEELNREWEIIDDQYDIQCFNFSYKSAYLISLYKYTAENSALNLRITKLNPEDNDRELLHLTRQIRILDRKARYLKWRLHQFNITDIKAKPQNVDYNNPQLLTPDERWNLYRYWIKMLYTKLCYDVPYIVDGFSHYKYQKAIDNSTIHIMERMHVIGMTTTGAAKSYDILQELKCPIVIVEEAAEVLEAHVVTSLSKDCQHLILIGDHKQLRPNTAQYNLAKKYNLEISLFERMVRNGIHCQQLDVQHRMRPEISRLIVPSIYSKLDDAANMHLYPPVRGVTSSVYFITHTEYEDTMHDSSSHKNVYEVIYLLELASYLVKQGYTSYDITILTTYSGQVSSFLQERKNNYSELININITGVDNFQGEESGIILLSLVRSNANANIGFLKTENRVCVALSRAKQGLYIIGNMDNLEASSKIWPQVKKALEEQDSIGPVLKLKCKNHDNLTEIKTPTDFKNVPNGGCHLPCNTILPCGHTCHLRCHPDDPKHFQYFCTEKCETRICARNHACPNPCGQDCDLCAVPSEMEFPCGHKNIVPCATKLTEYKCPISINVELSCGHSMDIQCHADRKEAECINQCGKTMPCGHTCIAVCHMGKDEDHVQYTCKEPCAKLKKDCSLKEHKCDLLCHQPCSPCEEQVKKRRTTCTHMITVPCNADADDTVCREKCRKLLLCGHHCPMKCFERCGNCRVQVTKVIEMCGHSLKVNCDQEPDRQLCKEQCPLKLKCEHVCKNKCNEPCTVNCSVFVRHVDAVTGEKRTDLCCLKPCDELLNE